MRFGITLIYISISISRNQRYILSTDLQKEPILLPWWYNNPQIHIIMCVCWLHHEFGDLFDFHLSNSCEHTFVICTMMYYSYKKRKLLWSCSRLQRQQKNKRQHETIYVCTNISISFFCIPYDCCGNAKLTHMYILRIDI